MRLDIIETKVPAGWDELVTQLGGNINHSSVFARYYIAAQPSAIPQFITLISDSGSVVGAALAFMAKSTNPLMSLFAGELRLPTIPVIRQDVPDGLQLFLIELELFARNKGCSELIIGSFAATWGSDEFQQRKYIITDRFEFELDLCQNEDVLRKGIGYKRRRNINKARRLGVELVDMNNDDGIDHLRRLQGDSSKRIVARGGRSIKRDVIAVKDPIQVYLDSGIARLVCAKVDGKVVSAALFTCFNGLVYYTMSGHNQAALKVQSSTFLLWEVINQYRQAGAKRFNLGGCKITAEQDGDPEHGLYIYKMRFGGKRLSSTSGRKVLSPFSIGIRNIFKRILIRS